MALRQIDNAYLLNNMGKTNPAILSTYILHLMLYTKTNLRCFNRIHLHYCSLGPT